MRQINEKIVVTTFGRLNYFGFSYSSLLLALRIRKIFRLNESQIETQNGCTFVRVIKID